MRKPQLCSFLAFEMWYVSVKSHRTTSYRIRSTPVTSTSAVNFDESIYTSYMALYRMVVYFKWLHLFQHLQDAHLLSQISILQVKTGQSLQMRYTLTENTLTNDG